VNPPQFEKPIWKHSKSPGYLDAGAVSGVPFPSDNAVFHSFMHNCGESVTSVQHDAPFGMLMIDTPGSVSLTPDPDGNAYVADVKFVNSSPDVTVAPAVRPRHSASASPSPVILAPLIRTTPRT
jgi:hypothetical protein